MKKMIQVSMILSLLQLSALADTNAFIEVKLFKNWVIKGEVSFGNLAIKNTGTEPILLAKDAFDFEGGQLCCVKERGVIDELYRDISKYGGFFELLQKETHVYDGRKFYLEYSNPFSEEMRFTVSVYLGNGFWLDSEPLTINGIVPDSEEHLTTITDVNGKYNLVAITYKNERWLYKTMPSRLARDTKTLYFPVCPLNTTNKIRVEPYDNKEQFRIWDGDKSMIFHLSKSVLTEGPDENNVLGKWTRDRKQKAEADNAEVRRKKAEAQTP